METFQKRPMAPQSLRPQEQNPPSDTAPDISGAMVDADEALGKVEIIHGAHQDKYDVAGKTVGYVRQALGDVFNIPRDAECLIDGRVVDETTIIRENSVVEFIKASGTKG
jgi:hypothetical protein